MAEGSIPRPARPSGSAIGVLIAVVVAVAGLLWAKWWPYQAKVHGLAASHAWAGSGIFGVGGVHPGDAPSWSAATSFTVAYGRAIWKALVVALLISAALQTLVPRTWLLRLLSRRRPVAAAVAGGLAATPSMMCTCCTAPVAVTLRRSGVPTAAVVAYWLGNPLLNPAVLVFLAFVAPWPWTVTRLVAGAAVVVGGSVLVARLADRRVPEGLTVPEPPADEPPSLRRYLGALLRLILTLVPEYLIVVMLVGAFRGWLFPLGGGFRAGLLVVVVAAVVGTLLVIPTAGEIPIVQGLVLGGLSLGVAGALLITLPAVSLPGIAMVARTFGWRVTAATTAVVIAGGLAAAALLPALSL